MHSNPYWSGSAIHTLFGAERATSIEITGGRGYTGPVSSASHLSFGGVTE